MAGILSQISASFAVLAVPSNLAAVIVGLLAGTLLAAPFQRIGLAGTTALVVAMPAASRLDPTAGLVLLGAMAAAALTIGAHDFHRTGPQRAWPVSARNRVPVVALLAGLVLIGGSDVTADIVKSLSATDRLMLLVAGAALAVIVSTELGADGWATSLALVAAGIVCQIGPVPLLDTRHASPFPVLAGLLVIGPALMALAWPGDEPAPPHGRGATHLAAKVVPAFLAGLPVTLGAALFALNLDENGLVLGPRLKTQQPKLMLGLVLAMILASIVAALIAMQVDRLREMRHWPSLPRPTTMRLAAGLVLAVTLIGFYWTGIDSEWLAFTAVAACVGCLAAYHRVDLAPFVVGLVLGQLMQPPLHAALTEAGGRLLPVLTAGSWSVIAATLLTIAAALAWPWVTRSAS